MTAERPTDQLAPAEPARPDCHAGDLRAGFLRAAFFAPDDQLETTLPPDDADAGLARGSITFFLPTRRGVQPVILSLWRRLD